MAHSATPQTFSRRFILGAAPLGGLMVAGLVAAPQSQARGLLSPSMAAATTSISAGTLVGARAKSVNGSLAGDFTAAQAQLGALQVTRVFYGALPPTHQRISALGVREIISFKDSSGANLESFVRSLSHGEMLTFYHEPEGPSDWADGKAYKTAWRALYRRSKAANSSTKFGMIAGAYQYRVGGLGYDGSFLPLGMADWFAVDTYRTGATESGFGSIVTLPNVAEFQRWYSFVAPTGRPLAITEYGRGTVGYGEVPSTPSKRIQVLAPDRQWASDHGFFAFDQWFSNYGPEGKPWVPTDQAFYDAFRALPRA
jgi:hypothetical protein